MDVSETFKGTDYLILVSNLFVESVIDLALKKKMLFGIYVGWLSLP